MRCCVVCLCVAVPLFTSGCGTDYKEIADRRVQEKLFATYEKREAIAFFEQQGRYFDRKDGKTTVDRDVVLPLLKRLAEVAPTEQWVMIRPKDKDWAGALLIALPDNAQTVDQMAQVVQEADDQFPGLILQQWGHEWLALDFLDEEMYKLAKEADPDIDKQR